MKIRWQPFEEHSAYTQEMAKRTNATYKGVIAGTKWEPWARGRFALARRLLGGSCVQIFVHNIQLLALLTFEVGRLSAMETFTENCTRKLTYRGLPTPPYNPMLQWWCWTHCDDGLRKFYGFSMGVVRIIFNKLGRNCKNESRCDLIRVWAIAKSEWLQPSGSPCQMVLLYRFDRINSSTDFDGRLGQLGPLIGHLMSFRTMDQLTWVRFLRSFDYRMFGLWPDFALYECRMSFLSFVDDIEYLNIELSKNISGQYNEKALSLLRYLINNRTFSLHHHMEMKIKYIQKKIKFTFLLAYAEIFTPVPSMNTRYSS